MESSEELVLDLFRLAARAPAQTFQSEVLAKLKSICPFNGAMWGVGTFSVTAMTLYHCMTLHGISNDVFTEFRNVAKDDSVAATVAHNKSAVAAFNVAERSQEPRFAAFLDYAQRHHFNNLLYATAPYAPSYPRAKRFIALWRYDNGDRFTDTEVERMHYPLLAALDAGAINDRLSFKSTTTLREGSDFCRARVSLADIVEACDPGFLTLLSEPKAPPFMGPFLPRYLREKLKGPPHHIINKHIIATAVIDNGMMFIVARRNPHENELPPRLLETTRLIVRGYSNEYIAQQLGVTKDTVQGYVSNIYSEFGFDDAKKWPTIPTAGPSGNSDKGEAKVLRELQKRAALTRWWLRQPGGFSEHEGTAGT